MSNEEERQIILFTMFVPNGHILGREQPSNLLSKSYLQRDTRTTRNYPSTSSLRTNHNLYPFPESFLVAKRLNDFSKCLKLFPILVYIPITNL